MYIPSASAMAAPTTPSHQQVVKALEVLSNDEIEDLIFHLGVPANVLEDIEKGRTFMIYAIKAWLDRDPGASWEKIVSGLKEVGKDTLAKKVAQQYCKQSTYYYTSHSSDPSQPSSLVTTHLLPPSLSPSVATTSADVDFQHDTQLVCVIYMCVGYDVWYWM